MIFMVTIKFKERMRYKAMTYETWKALLRTRMHEDAIKVKRFENENPGLAAAYKQRSIAEEKKRRKIMEIKDPDERQMAIAKNMDIFYQDGILTM